MERWAGKVAIVTGASAGIGATVAEKLVRSGLVVVGLARRVERIQTLANSLLASNAPGKLYGVKCDMTQESDILKAFQWTTSNVGKVHILINNAGANLGGNLIDGITDNWRTMFEINVIGLLIATREAIKIMRENNIDGHIVNVNSVAGHTSIYIPSFNVYPATKHAVTNLSHCLRDEITAQGLNVKVTSVSPGLVQTEFFTEENLPQESADMFKGWPYLEAKDVADTILYVLSTPPEVHIGELTLRPKRSPA